MPTSRLFVALKSRPRDEILIRFILQTGLRLQEVCNTTVDDVIENPDGWYVRVRQGKGRKDRIVPLDTPQERLSARRRRYVDRVWPRQTRSRALLLSARKLNGEYGPLTRHSVQVLCQRLTEEIRIHVNAHRRAVQAAQLDLWLRPSRSTRLVSDRRLADVSRKDLGLGQGHVLLRLTVCRVLCRQRLRPAPSRRPPLLARVRPPAPRPARRRRLLHRSRLTRLPEPRPRAIGYVAEPGEWVDAVRLHRLRF